MRLRRFMRCDRGLRKSIRVAFSDGYPGEAATTGLGYGDSDRETQALDSSGPGACPVSAIYPIAGPGTNFPQAEGGVDKGRRRVGSTWRSKRSKMPARSGRKTANQARSAWLRPDNSNSRLWLDVNPVTSHQNEQS